LPTSINLVFVARLDRLPTLLRQIVQTAAVFGRTFAAPVLAQMMADALDLSPWLDQLVHLQICHAVGPQHYQFQHALLCDAAYDMQLPAHLRTLHQQAAEAIRLIYRQDLTAQAPDIAYHYDQAAIFQEAVRWYEVASNDAAGRFANEDALHHVTRALALAAPVAHDPPDQAAITLRFRLLLRCEKVNDVLGKRTAQGNLIAELQSLPQALLDPEQRAEVYLRLANYGRLTGNYPGAIDAAQQAVMQARQSHPATRLLQAFHLWGRILWQQGYYDAARIKLRHALDLARASGEQVDEAGCLYDIGITYYHEDRYEQALDWLRQAQAIYQAANDPRGVIRSLIMFGNITRERGDTLGAQQIYLEAQQLCQVIGWRYGANFLQATLANCYFDLGDYTAAQQHYGAAVFSCHESGDTEGEALSLAALSLVHHLHNHNRQSHDHAIKALQMQQALGDRNGAAFSLTYLGHAHRAEGAIESALAAYEEALALRTALGMTAKRMDCLAGVAQTTLQLGDLARARAAAHEILGWFQTHGAAGVELPVWVMLACYNVFNASAAAMGADAQSAQQALALGYKLLVQQASQIHNEDLRTQFLDKPYHRQLRIAWQQTQGSRDAANSLKGAS
jgi:tetratricopeptide (TPR) repeat protein